MAARQVPAPLVHEPWKLSRSDMQRYGVNIGVDYPLPPKSRFAGAADYYEGGGGWRGGGGGNKGRGGKGCGGGRSGGRGGKVPRVQHGY
jgi:deoxyribodipyrimidine photo-lyase